MLQLGETLLMLDCRRTERASPKILRVLTTLTDSPMAR